MRFDIICFAPSFVLTFVMSNARYILEFVRIEWQRRNHDHILIFDLPIVSNSCSNGGTSHPRDFCTLRVFFFVGCMRDNIWQHTWALARPVDLIVFYFLWCRFLLLAFSFHHFRLGRRQSSVFGSVPIISVNDWCLRFVPNAKCRAAFYIHRTQ